MDQLTTHTKSLFQEVLDYLKEERGVDVSRLENLLEEIPTKDREGFDSTMYTQCCRFEQAIWKAARQFEGDRQVAAEASTILREGASLDYLYSEDDTEGLIERYEALSKVKKLLEGALPV